MGDAHDSFGAGELYHGDDCLHLITGTALIAVLDEWVQLGTV